MGLLWRWERKQKLKTDNYKKPSPTNQKLFPNSARNPEIFLNRRDNPVVKSRFIKGPSLPALLLKCVKAGMTVEAVLVLPLFCFFMLNLGSFIEMIRLHNNIQMALWNIGSGLAVYGHAADDERYAASLFSAFYLKARMTDYLGEKYLEESPLNDADGLQIWESDMFTSSDELGVTVTYRVSPWCPLTSFMSFRMANRLSLHIWNGYEIPETVKDSVMVYVTENGQVYHISRSCTHLALSIRQADAKTVSGIRNSQGKRYTACTICVSRKEGEVFPVEVFVTDEGEHYHYSAGCPGLKRTVFMISKEQAAGYRMCSRCGGG